MKLAAGTSLPRVKVEAVMVEQSKKMERPYVVVWDLSAKANKHFADRGSAFSAPLLAGGTFDFKTVLGKKPVVLTFWASWCAPCLAEAPHLVALYNKYTTRGVAFVAVSIDEADDYATLRKMVARLKLPYPVVLDPKGQVLGKYAKGASIPLTFVIDRSGAVTYRHQNFEPGDEVGIEAAIVRVMER